MFGLGATSDNHTIPSMIAKYLMANPLLSDKRIQVTNMAMLGYTSSQELLLLKAYIDSFDIVVVLDGWNELDQYHPSGLSASSYYHLHRSVPGSPWPHSILRFMRASYFLQIIQTLLAQCLVTITRLRVKSRAYPTNYSLYW
jgi:hypothetical protein